MPQIFKLGSYNVYFWSNESCPLEPVHVHVSQGSPSREHNKNLDYEIWKMLVV